MITHILNHIRKQQVIKTIIRPRKFNDQQWKALISVNPKTLLTSNSKLKKSGIWNFTLPAVCANVIKSNGTLTNINTCQGAGACKNFCYSSGGCYTFDNCMIKHHRNLQMMLSNPFEFVEQIVEEINNKPNLKYLRWHDSGDFIPTLWVLYKTVMERCPTVKFYAYTKMITFFNSLKDKNDIPANFHVIYSFGGIHDSKIDINKDCHSRVFKTRKELRLHGYTDCHVSDVPAATGRNLRIGLIVHGSAVSMKIIKKNDSINKLNNKIESDILAIAV